MSEYKISKDLLITIITTPNVSNKEMLIQYSDKNLESILTSIDPQNVDQVRIVLFKQLKEILIERTNDLSEEITDELLKRIHLFSCTFFSILTIKRFFTKEVQKIRNNEPVTEKTIISLKCGSVPVDLAYLSNYGNSLLKADLLDILRMLQKASVMYHIRYPEPTDEELTNLLFEGYFF